MHASDQKFQIQVKSGHPDFLDLPWNESISDWTVRHFVDLPKAYSRHAVRFLEYPQGIYVIKELPMKAAQRDFDILSELESHDVLSAVPVGVITGRHPDSGAEQSAALITEYISYSLSYFELLQGHGFGFRRQKMLDAFAGLLVQLHLCGCFWGDCSLGNVLYRYDADGIEVIMIDAETSFIYPQLSKGQRQEDLEIMKINIAGGMADIAASQEIEMLDADLAMGKDIEKRYHEVWAEIMDVVMMTRDEHHLIHKKIDRLNQLGFNVDSISLREKDNAQHLKLKVKVGSRNFHTARLKGFTGVDALERQARVILSDVHYYQLLQQASTDSHKMLAAAHWRMYEFEPTLAKIRALADIKDPLQAYCDLLYVRYNVSSQRGYPVSTQEAFEIWMQAGQPGYPEDRYVI